MESSGGKKSYDEEKEIFDITLPERVGPKFVSISKFKKPEKVYKPIITDYRDLLVKEDSENDVFFNLRSIIAYELYIVGKDQESEFSNPEAIILYSKMIANKLYLKVKYSNYQEKVIRILMENSDLLAGIANNWNMLDPLK